MPDQPNLTRPSELRALLTQLDFHPSRILGQNFLIDRNILNILLEAAELSPTDTLIEVGPGLGVLTAALLEKVSTLTAIEKDNRLAPIIRERFASNPHFTLIHSDILECDLPALFPHPGTKLVANLPYAIAARLLVELTTLPHPPTHIIVTIQREVADRLMAQPSTNNYGLLTILIQRHYTIRTIKQVSPTCFWPPPEVQSTIVKLILRPAPLGGPANETALRELLRHAFSRRRKTIARTLRDLIPDPLPALHATHIAPTTRAEDLPPEIWPTLLKNLTP